MDASLLNSMNIALGEPLDVDNRGPWDVTTNFFMPWVCEEFIQEVGNHETYARSWTNRWQDRGSICPVGRMIAELESHLVLPLP